MKTIKLGESSLFLGVGVGKKDLSVGDVAKTFKSSLFQVLMAKVKRLGCKTLFGQSAATLACVLWVHY